MYSDIDKINKLTPIERINGIYLKRDDLFTFAGVSGGKVRSCLNVLADKKPKGLVTAGSRSSPQVNIVAHIAKYLGIPSIAHTPKGELSKGILEAKMLGCNIQQHASGYNTVICKRAKDSAKETGYFYIPFGMECYEAVEATKHQVKNLPKDFRRLIIVAGSAMSLCGILHGFRENNINKPILAIIVGASPYKRLRKYAPFYADMGIKFIKSKYNYRCHLLDRKIGGVELDPIYEAKALDYLEKGDLFWIIGKRNI